MTFRNITTHIARIEIYNIEVPEDDEINVICDLTCKSMQIYEHVDAWIPKATIRKAWYDFTHHTGLNPLLILEDCDTQSQVELWFRIPSNHYEITWKRQTYGDIDLCMSQVLTLGQVVEIFAAMGFEDPKNRMLE